LALLGALQPKQPTKPRPRATKAASRGRINRRDRWSRKP